MNEAQLEKGPRKLNLEVKKFVCAYIALITSHGHLQYYLANLGVPTINFERKRLENHLNEAQMENGSRK